MRMLMLLSTSRPGATDLGYLLRKHPDRVGTFPLTFGTASVFWPVARQEQAVVALHVEVDPVALSRRTRPSDRRPLEPYVNDRPYVASSFLSVAIASVFSSALSGKAPEGYEALAEEVMPLEVSLPALSIRGGSAVLRELFEPLGYDVHADDLGDGIFSARLGAQLPLSVLLGHLYVLLPVLDDAKHYWVGDDEVEKLLRHGEGWLQDHPSRDRIVFRYLKHQSSLARVALARLSTDEAPVEDEQADDVEPVEGKVPLAEQRIQHVVEAVRALSPRTVADLGCGEGRILKRLFSAHALWGRLERLVGMDVSVATLEIARSRLKIEALPEDKRSKIELLHGSLLYRDARLKDLDLALCVEVIEHIDPERLDVFEDCLFGYAAPQRVLITTPNAEYNAKMPSPNRMRHADHRFEWTREQLASFASALAARRGYRFTISPIGPVDPALGPPTQAVLFEREAR